MTITDRFLLVQYRGIILYKGVAHVSSYTRIVAFSGCYAMTTVKNMRECQEEGVVVTISKKEQMAGTRDCPGSLESLGRDSRPYWKI